VERKELNSSKQKMGWKRWEMKEDDKYKIPIFLE